CYPLLSGLDTSPTAAAKAAGTSLRKGEAGALSDAAAFRRQRTVLQSEQVDRLAAALPLPQLRLPYLFDAEIGPDQLDLLASSFLEGVDDLDPAAIAVDASGAP
ncbi:MAG: hypothetical protein H0U29_06645, partial [Acidimicrobiia bacterium]|nr:hypothetical protein [Acidimicrobiia bacterium]